MDYKHRNLLLKNCMFIVRVTIITFLIIVFTFFKIASARIRDDRIDIFLEKIEANNKKINTISADYVQSIFFESTREEKKTMGNYFLKNCGVYINQKTPQKQQIYFNGKNITIYIPENRQVIIDNWDGSIDEKNPTSTTLLSFIGVCGDLKRIKKMNMIDFVGEDEKYILVKITLYQRKTVI